MTDPARMKDNAAVPEGLRELLRDVRDVAPSAGAFERLERAAAPLLGASGTAAAGTGAATASGVGVTGKSLIVALLAAGVVGGGTGLYWSIHEDSTTVPDVRTDDPATEPIVAAPEDEPMIDIPPPALRDETEEETRPGRQERNSRATLSEAELLRGAQDAVRSEPRRALRLVREHARRYPEGFMVQEREVIAIDALKRLGERRKAAERASLFLSRFPSSAHRARVAELVDAGS